MHEHLSLHTCEMFLWSSFLSRWNLQCFLVVSVGPNQNAGRFKVLLSITAALGVRIYCEQECSLDSPKEISIIDLCSICSFPIVCVFHELHSLLVFITQ